MEVGRQNSRTEDNGCLINVDFVSGKVMKANRPQRSMTEDQTDYTQSIDEYIQKLSERKTDSLEEGENLDYADRLFDLMDEFRFDGKLADFFPKDLFKKILYPAITEMGLILLEKNASAKKVEKYPIENGHYLKKVEKYIKSFLGYLEDHQLTEVQNPGVILAQILEEIIAFSISFKEGDAESFFQKIADLSKKDSKSLPKFLGQYQPYFYLILKEFAEFNSSVENSSKQTKKKLFSMLKPSQVNLENPSKLDTKSLISFIRAIEAEFSKYSLSMNILR